MLFVLDLFFKCHIEFLAFSFQSVLPSLRLQNGSSYFPALEATGVWLSSETP